MYAIYGNIYHQYTPNVSIPYMDPMGTGNRFQAVFFQLRNRLFCSSLSCKGWFSTDTNGTLSRACNQDFRGMLGWIHDYMLVKVYIYIYIYIIRNRGTPYIILPNSSPKTIIQEHLFAQEVRLQEFWISHSGTHLLFFFPATCCEKYSGLFFDLVSVLFLPKFCRIHV